MLRNASAMIAEREALRMGSEHLTVLFPTEVGLFDFPVECTDRTVQYKLNAQSLRLFGLHRDVNDAHRAGANRLQNKQTFYNLENVCVFNIASICIHGEEILRQLAFHQNFEDLTMKQMFDIFEKLISEQSDAIYGVKTINWENSSRKQLSLIGDEQVISLLHTNLYVFSDSVLCLGKMNEKPQSNSVWEDRLTWFKSSP